jgi:adenine-specific DNA-methyltransferase
MDKFCNKLTAFMATPREKFQELLKKLFQFDNAELDFGIYRIMNYKRAVIEQFIETDLVKGIAKELASGALAQEAGLVQQLAEVTAQLKENIGDEALDAEGNLAAEYHGSKLGKQYLALRERAGKSKATPELEADIFNHLYAFFSRYYDEGDFMSLRRYSKRDKYAIPYNGEEVHLHWANADQYYIKTGENFTDYSYKHGGWTVHFKLRNADVEQNNVKGAKRFFIPRTGDINLDGNARSLSILFEYRPLNADEEIGEEESGNGKAKAKRKKGQEGILADAVSAIQQAAKKNTDALAALLHEKRKDVDGNPVTLLDHHLRAYSRSNTTDFFIHKDLKGFLERELDFYLKNEVLNLDELEAGGEARSESWFQTLRAIKAIGRQIIAFVAQIENFQKRLFEKKKFVTEVHYCVTLDRVPEELYLDIAKNKAQIAEWKRLFHIHEIEHDTTRPGFKEPVKVEFLRANQFLVLDTKFFSPEFTDVLLASKAFLHSKSSVAEATDGLLLSSENLQALRLLQSNLRDQIDCVYIDPPFNTAASAILYKNDYKHSSWACMVYERVVAAFRLMKDTSIICVAIDDFEFPFLTHLLHRVFGEDRRLGTVLVRSNPHGRAMASGISTNHEYALIFGKTDQSVVGRIPRDDAKKARYPEHDQHGSFAWISFRKTGAGSNRTDRRKLFYPIFVATDGAIRISKMIWSEEKQEWQPLEPAKRNEAVVLPTDSDNVERVWNMGWMRASSEAHLNLAARKVGSEWQIYRKYRPNEEGALPGTWWHDAKYSATESGTRIIKDLLGEREAFSYPKSVFLVEDCLRAADCHLNAWTIDFFGGSGTTAHAVINLNREDKGSRKYVLIEMGDYFESVLKPRIQKAIYSKDWKDGKPVSRQGSSHAFKYLQLESYEDALDNIAFETGDSQALLELEDYTLTYMLDFETKSSDTLLNVAKLDAPFAYKLRRQGKDEPMAVDLAETFNYLIGLHVETRRTYDNKGTRYLVYRGKAAGRDTAIIWRTTRGWKQDQFEADRDFVVKHKLTTGAEDIFVNTDSFIEGARSLDPVFKKKMFNED